MIQRNPADLLELDSVPAAIDDIEDTWAAALGPMEDPDVD